MHSLLLFNIILEVLAISKKKEKKKDIHIGKKTLKSFLFTDINVHTGHQKESTKQKNLK